MTQEPDIAGDLRRAMVGISNVPEISEEEAKALEDGFREVAAGKGLTEAERAYRRGCYEAIHWALQGVNLTQEQAIFHLARWREALLESNGNQDIKYLGHYLDEVGKQVKEMAP